MMASKNANTRAYESIIIVQAETPTDAQKELFRKNKKIIEDHSGSVHHVDTWGRRTLGNPIHKNTKGVYFHSTFYADNKAVAELERTMRINDRVLRFVHTRLEEGTDLNQYMEGFKNELAANAAKEREREAKLMEKRAAAKRAALEGSRDDRDDE
jgi:small subunit ribosomal protein S6